MVAALENEKQKKRALLAMYNQTEYKNRMRDYERGKQQSAPGD